MKLRKRPVALAVGAVVLIAVSVPWAVAGSARPNARRAARRSRTCGPATTVKVAEQTKFAVNQYMQDGMRFVPGTVTVKSGCNLTFEFATPDQSDAHSLSIVKKSDLPRTAAQMESCKVCGKIAATLVKHPGQAPGPNNPIVHWVVNVGKPGLDQPGDSLGIIEGKGTPSGHAAVTAPVSAPAGTTLYFMCGAHAWMQGKIVVT